jgi:hypothetical protein
MIAALPAILRLKTGAGIADHRRMPRLPGYCPAVLTQSPYDAKMGSKIERKGLFEAFFSRNCCSH